jgi:hypothetical protein
MARGGGRDPAQNGYHGFQCGSPWQEGKKETPHKMGTTDFHAKTNGKKARGRPRTKWVPRISMRKPMARGQKGDPAQNGYHGFACRKPWKEGTGETPHKMGTTDSRTTLCYYYTILYDTKLLYYTALLYYGTRCVTNPMFNSNDPKTN